MRVTFQFGLMWTLALAAVVAAVAGSQLDSGGRNWLPQAGCFIVLLGLWSAVGELIQERFIRRGWLARKTLQARTIRRRHRSDLENQARALRALDIAYEVKLDHLLWNTRVTLGAIESSLLVVGTAIWGFGDLVGLPW